MSVEAAYQCLRQIIDKDEIESLCVASEVEGLRWAWKPDNVRVVLLAESHVWTSGPENRCRVKVVCGQPETGYARFVYCLGYGESSLVFPTVPEKNGGTWQYWRLFHDCLNAPDDSYRRLLKSGERDTGRRIKNKIELLKEMQARGVWLVDASVTALYRPGREKKLAEGDAYDRALRVSWNEHVKDKLAECRPRGILVVGKAVGNALPEKLIRESVPNAEIKMIFQPNAHLTTCKRAAQRQCCHEFCSRYIKKTR